MVFSQHIPNLPQKQNFFGGFFRSRFFNGFIILSMEAVDCFHNRKDCKRNQQEVYNALYEIAVVNGFLAFV